MADTSNKVTIRRRGGDHRIVRTEVVDGTVHVQHQFEHQQEELPMAQRLRAAAVRVAAVATARRSVLHNVVLREEQHDVFQDAATYFVAAADHLESQPEVPFTYARYIQPPRTGKAIIIAQIFGAAELTSVVLVPSQDLVRQMADSLRKTLPHARVGVYYGEEKELVTGGINVATYQIVQQRALEGTLPIQIRQSALIFCDEAHKAMTDARMSMLLSAFSIGALRIACTATPDWNDKRVLAAYFPYLIHEITLEEAEELDLFARILASVLGCRVDGSVIRLVGGDLDQRVLGDIMSTDPFLEATRFLRYEKGENAKIPALICCASRTQARKVQEYLVLHRPPDSTIPELVLGDTPSRDRREVLRRYMAGEIDTLINVGVLIEGWDSPRCKLLIDLAPTLSDVRAKQKYFRVMTKFGEAVAYIYVLLPDNLAQMPVLPQMLFGKSVEVEGFDDWLASQIPPKRKAAVPKPAQTEPKKPRNVDVLPGLFDSARARLDPNSVRSVISVITSKFRMVHRIPSFTEFRRQPFQHRLFEGSGAQLLRYCGIRPRFRSYMRFVYRLFPDLKVNRFLEKAGHTMFGELPSCTEEVDQVEEAVIEGTCHDASWLFPPSVLEIEDVEDAIDDHMTLEKVRGLVESTCLSEQQKIVITHRYLSDDDVPTMKAVGEKIHLSGAQIGNVEHDALVRLRDSYQRLFPTERNVLEVLDPARKHFVHANPMYSYLGKTVWYIDARDRSRRISWDGWVWCIPKGTVFFDLMVFPTGELALRTFAHTRSNGTLVNYRVRILVSPSS